MISISRDKNVRKSDDSDHGGIVYRLMSWVIDAAML
jgi:hypothetical protein